MNTSPERLAALTASRDAATLRLTLHSDPNFDSIYYMSKSLQRRLRKVPDMDHLNAELKEVSDDYIYAAQHDYMSHDDVSAKGHDKELDRLDCLLGKIVRSTS